MTEAEWLACADPRPMLKARRGGLSLRKLRLFACACARRIRALIPENRYRRLVEAAEAFADGALSADDLRAALHHAVYGKRFRGRKAVYGTPAVYAACWTANTRAPVIERSAAEAAQAVGDAAARSRSSRRWKEARAGEHAAQAVMLRCVAGNPFRPVAIDPAWLTSDVVALARGIYEERAFDRLPILADALQDAGCDNADVLDHCRGPGPHVRGCWVVDLILGQ
jgi:hypothetical protein